MKKKNYLIISLITLSIICLVLIIKRIFPFGNNLAIWSDMHEQITAMYYHFWDSVRSTSSLMVDFSSGMGINFIGLVGYYILSPFTLIVLLFPRDMIVYSTSIIIVLKMLVSSITCLYAVDKLFKNIPNTHKILLSLLYTFSSYVLISYVITSWMDAVYLLPLLVVGLKKVFDLEDNRMYVIVLTLSLIFCFYISFLVLIFVIIVSFLYIHFYKEKEKRRKIIFRLAISTVISILCASFILVPTFLQLSESARLNTDITSIMNSRFGPLSDKLAFFFNSGISIAMLYMLIFKENVSAKNKKFIIIILLLLIMPIMIEPINKILHLGSYTGFPYRYGLITMLALTFIAGYYLNNVEDKKTTRKKMLITILITIIGISSLIIITKLSYTNIQQAVDKLTLTSNKSALLSLFIMFIITFITSLTILLLNKNKSRFSYLMLVVLAIANISTTSLLHIGIDHDQENLKARYKQMTELSKIKEKKDNYYMKITPDVMISNFGMVSKYNTIANFTSLINNNNFETLQRLGYDSYSMDTEPLGGTLFTDTLLAQKYIATDKTIESEYYKLKTNIEDLNIYEMTNNISYGYLIDEIPNTKNTKNSFEFSNIIYNSITKKHDLFEIYDTFENNNVKEEKKNNKISLVKLEDDAYLTKTINIKKKKSIYLETFYSYDFRNKTKEYKSFEIMVNGNKIEKEYPYRYRNGVLDLGTFEEEEVTITLKLLKNTNNIDHISIGVMDIEKYDDFATNYKVNADVNISGNEINIKMNSISDKILFIPISYLDDYKVSNNLAKSDLLKVYDNFIGVNIHTGENNIKLTYSPKGLSIGLLMTIIGIFLAISWFKYSFEFKIINNLVYLIFLIVSIALIITIYVITPLFFIKSFI